MEKPHDAMHRYWTVSLAPFLAPVRDLSLTEKFKKYCPVFAIRRRLVCQSTVLKKFRCYKVLFIYCVMFTGVAGITAHV